MKIYWNVNFYFVRAFRAPAVWNRNIKLNIFLIFLNSTDMLRAVFFCSRGFGAVRSRSCSTVLLKKAKASQRQILKMKTFDRNWRKNLVRYVESATVLLQHNYSTRCTMSIVVAVQVCGQTYSGGRNCRRNTVILILYKSSWNYSFFMLLRVLNRTRFKKSFVALMKLTCFWVLWLNTTLQLMFLYWRQRIWRFFAWASTFVVWLPRNAIS